MADVYHNSSCNIAAAGATDGSFGLFFNRDPKELESSIVYPRWVTNPRSPCVIVDLYSTVINYIKQPLFQRAWVVQERLLSSRTIHFGDRQVFWECQQRIACESSPTGLPLQSMASPNLPFLGLFQRKANFWNNIVGWYSHCSLTYPSDKLVALSGIAAHLHQSAPEHYGSYLAGLWSSGLPYDLLWEVTPRKSLKDSWLTQELEIVRRASTYRAPSWSWVSVEGHIQLPTVERDPSISYEILATVEYASIINTDANKFGQISAASLRLRGPVSQVTFGKLHDDLFIASFIDFEGTVHETRPPDIDSGRASASGGGKSALLHAENLAGLAGYIPSDPQRPIYSKAIFDLESDKLGQVDAQSPAFALAVLARRPPDKSFKSAPLSRRINGILLRQTPNQTFERVGTFYITVRPDQINVLDELLDLFPRKAVEIV